MSNNEKDPLENWILTNAMIHNANNNPETAQHLYLLASEKLLNNEPLQKNIASWLGKVLQDLAFCDTTDRSEIRKILHQPNYRNTSTKPPKG